MQTRIETQLHLAVHQHWAFEEAMDGDGWSDGHLALFDALSAICKTIGKESAAEVAKSVAQSDGRHYIAELNRLRVKAEKADQFQVENARLRSELDDALRQIEQVKTNALLHAKASSVEKGLKEVQSEESYQRRFEMLVERHNPLVVSHGLLKETKDRLEATLKKRATERDSWIAYANGLLKKIEKQEKTLKEYSLFKDGSRSADLQAPVPASIGAKRLIRQSGTESYPPGTRSQSAPSSNLPKLVSSSSSEPGGETLLDTPKMSLMESTKGAEGSYLQGDHSQDDSETPGTSENNLCVDRLPRISPKTPKGFTASSPNYHSSSTQGEADEMQDHVADTVANATTFYQNPAPPIKEESPDSPVLLFTRSVKKSVTRRHSPRSSIVKVEDYADSPSVSVTQAHQLDLRLQESMDLDDIGEKIHTPKKKRQVKVDVQQAFGATFALNLQGPTALQTRSPNKQVVRRTSPRGRPLKRKRADDHSRDVELITEDGENYEGGTLVSKIKNIRVRGVQLEPQMLDARLSGLLENQSPQRQVLSHTKKQRQPLLTCPLAAYAVENDWAQQSGKPTSVNAKRFSKSGHDRVSTPCTDLQATGARKTPQTACLNTSSVENFEISRIEADDPEHEPFRARPVGRLGLEHFKVNQNFNGGYNYAFQEVVRGREQRKCLPGCIKSECCGDIFRKIVESTMVDEPTHSQEESDERLLEEYLGRNKCRLHTMNNEERKDVLIEAKVRELANKSARHRHAFERRRSPPGFWRSDFPTTQESEADRREARRIERKLVQERYDEAMRQGRWKFADE